MRTPVKAATAAEEALGYRAMLATEKKYGRWCNADTGKRLREIASEIERVSGYSAQWSILVINCSQPNALALPGGNIVVTRGLMALLPENELLVAAIWHEVAHIVLGHLREIATEQTIASSSIAPAKHRRPRAHVREQRADQAAARWLCVLGIDPRAMVEVLRRLSRVPELDATNSQTHPTWSSRIDSLQNYLRSVKFRRHAQTKRPVSHG